jgi:regulator of replication initiation timing
MEKIDFRIIKPETIGLLHDSRKDVRTLAKVCNHLIDKVNELIEENNRLQINVQKISNQQ